jgi:hypothetical protein
VLNGGPSPGEARSPGREARGGRILDVFNRRATKRSGPAARQATAKLATFSSQKKIPVIIGEFSVTPGEKYPRDSASRILWMETVAKTALSDSMVPVLWDTGSEISRTDGSLSKELQSVMTYIKQ